MATHEITKLLLEFSDRPQEISNELGVLGTTACFFTIAYLMQ
jgi:hypothetical protein